MDTDKKIWWVGAAMVAATEVVYLPWSVISGKKVLFGWDYMMLHLRRLRFAQEAGIAGWFPREMMGAPFAANLQSFPWIPSHWVLLAFRPESAFAVAVAIAAGLAAVFTYLYCRSIGLRAIGAAAAGWTVTCAGFFAARVEVGHLTLLEAYPGLPALLWLIERGPPERRLQPGLAAPLAFASACLAVAGHPQIPVYAIATAILYAAWTRKWRAIGAMTGGVGAAAVVWWPMAGLIGRSTRVLALDPAANDIVMPYRRLLALFVPGIDGWPGGVRMAASHPFSGYPHPGYFWDTVGYVGLLPWIAGAALAARCIAQKRWPGSRWIFWALLGCGALIGCLPLAAPLREMLPGTFLRSPSRLLYLCTFALAIAFGAGVDAMLRYKRTAALVCVCLLLHGVDLGRFARLFVVPVDRMEIVNPEIDGLIAREGSEGRIAVSRTVALASSAEYDDAGGFDAIFLADPYRKALAWAGAPPQRNEEVVDAAAWPGEALRSACVHLVITPQVRPDLELLKNIAGLRVYRVMNPAPRVSIAGGMAEYNRVSSDEMRIRVDTRNAGVIEVAESYDPGWRAEVDGVAAPIAETDGFGMAVQVGAGVHEARLRYRTPGRWVGLGISLGSLMLLVLTNREMYGKRLLKGA